MARECLEAQLKLKYETNCSQMASHNVINTKNITAYGSELHCRGCSQASTCQADRPNFEATHTHTHTMQTAHKNRAPNTYGNPAASCLLLMCCPSSPLSPFLSLLSIAVLLTLFGQFFLCASLLVGLSVSRVFRVFGLINWVNGAYENLEFAMSRWQRRQHDFNNLLKCARRQKLLAKTKEFVGKL